MSRGQGRRGRPLGFKLSDYSKRAISASKKGQRHRNETKDKISRSLLIYFREKDPLSEELINMYCRADDDELCGWINDVSSDLDSADDIMTIRSLRNTLRIEITVGNNIEYFSHDVNPEMLVLFKEVCEELGKDPMEFFDELGGM
jgi:hypothetical protein